MSDFYSFKFKTLSGGEFDFATLKGKKVLIINTASECGYTPQYARLEYLYDKYHQKNFMIIGFPCNDFGSQEPGTNDEIISFCSKNFGVKFPLMEKMSIAENPLYQWLTQREKNGVLDATIEWNFNKFLIDEEGKVIQYLPSGVEPTDDTIIHWIEQ